MAPLRIPPGEHPDGDPFAEQDRLREANSVLGRMEARARDEEAAEQAKLAGQPPPPTPSVAKAQAPHSTRSSSRATPVVNYGQTGRRSRSSVGAPAEPSPVPAPAPVARAGGTRGSGGHAITIESSEDEGGAAAAAASAAAAAAASAAAAAAAAAQQEADVVQEEDKAEAPGEVGGGGDPDALEDEEGGDTPQAQAPNDNADDDEAEQGEEAEDDDDDEGDDEDDGDGEGDGSDDQASQNEPQSEGDDDDDEESGSGSEDLGSDDDDDDDQVGQQLKRKREGSTPAGPAKRRLVDSPNGGPSSAPTSDADDHDNGADTSLAFSVAGPQDSPAVLKKKPKRAVLSSLGRAASASVSAPASDDPASAAGSGTEDGAGGAKPKRKYKYKAAVVPDKPKEVRTIRLELRLPPPGTNAVDGAPQFSVIQLAKDAGLVSDTEAKAPAEEEQSEGGSGDEEDEGGDGNDKKDPAGEDKMEVAEEGQLAGPMEGGKTNGTGPVVLVPQKRRRAKNRIIGRFGGYDVDDPFVDDSEIAFYEPKYYHKPKRDGYFVCSGRVETLEETTKRRGRMPGSKNKPKFDAQGNLLPPVPGAPPGTAPPLLPHGTIPSVLQPAVPPSIARMLGPTSPAPSPGPSAPAFGAGNDALPPLKAAPEPAPRGPGRWPRKELPELDKKVVREHLSDELKDALEVLRRAKDRETFVKGKFPPDLRPVLLEVAHKALALDEFDDLFFAELPKILPYNNFTLKKLVKRELFWTRVQRHEQEQQKHLDTVRRGVDDMLQPQQEEFARRHQEWQAAERTRLQALADWDNNVNVPGMAAVNAERPSETPAAEPVFKFKLSDEMKASLLFILDLEDKMSDLKIEKQNFEKTTENGKEKPWSVQSARKAIYAKVCSFWPDGVMTSNQLSRENSVLKLRIKTRAERQAAGHQGDDSD